MIHFVLDMRIAMNYHNFKSIFCNFLYYVTLVKLYRHMGEMYPSHAAVFVARYNLY